MAVVLDCILPSVAYRWTLSQGKVPVFHNLHAERFKNCELGTDEILERLYQPFVDSDVYITPGILLARICPWEWRDEDEIQRLIAHCFRNMEHWLLFVPQDVQADQFHPSWDSEPVAYQFEYSLQLIKQGYFSKVIQLSADEVSKLPHLGVARP
jgi:hypothetical protein